MNELCNFIMTNFWSIALVIALIKWNAGFAIAECVLLMFNAHPAVLAATAVISLLFPSKMTVGKVEIE